MTTNPKDIYGEDAWNKMCDEDPTLRAFEAASAMRVLACPRSRCKSPLKYDPRTLGFRCSSEKCNYREGTALDKFIKPFVTPPAGSDYWVTTVAPPYWFWHNEFK